MEVAEDFSSGWLKRRGIKLNDACKTLQRCPGNIGIFVLSVRTQRDFIGLNKELMFKL